MQKEKEMSGECLCILLSCSGPQLLDSSESVSVETHSAQWHIESEAAVLWMLTGGIHLPLGRGPQPWDMNWYLLGTKLHRKRWMAGGMKPSPPLSASPSKGKLSSTKQAPGTKKVGDHCSRSSWSSWLTLYWRTEEACYPLWSKLEIWHSMSSSLIVNMDGTH